MLVEAGLFEPDKISKLVHERWRAPAAVLSFSAVVGNEAVMAAGGLKHVAHDNCVLSGCLLEEPMLV